MYQNAEELAFFRKSNFTIVCRVSNIYSGFLSRTGALQGTRVVRGSRTFLRKKGVFPMFTPLKIQRVRGMYAMAHSCYSYFDHCGFFHESCG